ncbi:MAG: hypothetical protein RML45_06755 [Acetobacteraceae bacterium]|nr:hypothetical protein [Acetobacteraceae bacterium]
MQEHAVLDEVDARLGIDEERFFEGFFELGAEVAFAVVIGAEGVVQALPAHPRRPLEGVQAIGEPEIDVEGQALAGQGLDRRLEEHGGMADERLVEALRELDELGEEFVLAPAAVVRRGEVERAADDRVLPAFLAVGPDIGDGDQRALDPERLLARGPIALARGIHPHRPQPGVHRAAEFDLPRAVAVGLVLEIDHHQPTRGAVGDAVIAPLFVLGRLDHQGRSFAVGALPGLIRLGAPVRQIDRAQDRVEMGGGRGVLRFLDEDVRGQAQLGAFFGAARTAQGRIETLAHDELVLGCHGSSARDARGCSLLDSGSRSFCRFGIWSRRLPALPVIYILQNPF